ncbi:MAG: PhoU domain-containing protein [Candidatus Eisenbacteria sp.]|nr:PhoU domain-containing protein [Candidatus Eisenbacteria bacterium]
MWKQLVGLFKKDGLCEEAFQESLDMLELCRSMFCDAIASLWEEGALEIDIYARDRAINRFERDVRRKIVTHLAVSTKPDINTALVLTAIVMDIERIGDYTKNIVELAAVHPGRFSGGELAGEVRGVEGLVESIFADIIPTMREAQVDKARQILGDHQIVVGRVEEALQELIAGRALVEHSQEAVVAALYLRYLKRVSAHLKNVATSVVNPYYRIGFREKGAS